MKENIEVTINKYRLVRRIKWVLYYLFRPFIQFENMFYCHKKNKIQRLFCTTGNISLINALAIIKEIENYDKYDDILIIDSNKGEDSFMKKQLEIAKIHKFKKILASARINPGVQCVLNNLWCVDEIYIVNHPLHLNTVLPLYKNAEVNLIDEGVASLINYGLDKITNLRKIKTHKYLDKLDFMGIDDINKYNFETVDVEKFKQVANYLSKQYPINVEYNKEDKYVLYCGIYWEVTGLSREKFIQIQSDMLNELLNAGYKILYKPHPRDNEYFGFDKNPNVIFIDSKYPIELYYLDIVAIVSVSSTSSITYSHYWGIPGVSNIVEESLKEDKNDIANINIVRYILQEYSLNYKELLEFNTSSISKEDLKSKLKDLYNKYIDNKPLLSENKYIRSNIE